MAIPSPSTSMTRVASIAVSSRVQQYTVSPEVVAGRLGKSERVLGSYSRAHAQLVACDFDCLLLLTTWEKVLLLKIGNLFFIYSYLGSFSFVKIVANNLKHDH